MSSIDSNERKNIDLASSFFSNHHPLFNAMQISIVEAPEGYAKMYMPFNSTLCDNRGALHRGAMVTLLDTTCGLAIFSTRRCLKPIATIDLRVDYLDEIPAGEALVAVVTCIDAASEAIVYIQGHAETESGIRLARVSGSFAIGTLGPDFNLTNQG